MNFINKIKEKSNNKLSRKLKMYFIIMSIIPLIIMAFISININKEALEEATKIHLSDLVRDCAGKISFFVDNKYLDIKTLSEMYEFQNNDNMEEQKLIGVLSTRINRLQTTLKSIP